MTLPRRVVLERLCSTTDPRRGETTTPAALASSLDVEERIITDLLHALEACELARWSSDGDVRVTITGEELLELDVGEGVVVDPVPEESER